MTTIHIQLRPPSTECSRNVLAAQQWTRPLRRDCSVENCALAATGPVYRHNLITKNSEQRFTKNSEESLQDVGLGPFRSMAVQFGVGKFQHLGLGPLLQLELMALGLRLEVLVVDPPRAAQSEYPPQV